MPAAIAYVGKLIIDGVTRALAEHSTAQRNAVLSFVLLELVLVALLLAMQRAAAICDALLRSRLSQRVVELVLEKALTLSLANFEDAELYDELNYVRTHATERPLSLVRRALLALQLGVSLVGFLWLVGTFSGWLVALLLIASVPGVLLEARFNADAFRLSRSYSPEARRQAYLETVLSRNDHSKEVSLFGLGPYFLERHRRIFDTWYRVDRSLTLKRGKWAFALALITAGALAASYLWVSWRAMQGATSIGSMAMLFAVLRQAQTSATELFIVIAGMYDDNLYLVALQRFLDFKAAVPGKETSPGPKPGDGLRFANVEFTYPGEATPALRGFDFHLPPGTTVGVVGKNGAGKSTFIKLALGMYVPSSGRVTLDGRELRDWAPTSLSRRFSALFQDYVHYQLTAGQNIGVGSVERVDDGELWERAGRRAQVHPVVSALPSRYQTQLGHWFEGGHELSHGEWQKIALARCLARETADIVVLDEPTASVDAASEASILSEIFDFAKNRSAIIVSHRLSTLRTMDQLLVFEDGRCVERGTHEALVAANGLYDALFRAQAAGYR